MGKSLSIIGDGCKWLWKGIKKGSKSVGKKVVEYDKNRQTIYDRREGGNSLFK